MADIHQMQPLLPPLPLPTSSTEEMRALIVYAHHSSHSFNAVAKEEAKNALEEEHWKVEVSDLYAMNFKVTTTAEDIVDGAQEEDFQYADAAEKAWREGKLSADICEEQRKLREAKLVIFQFPMYWFSVPAILKGWMDRVLTKGFAYTDEQGSSEGLFSGTKVLLSFTTGCQESMFIGRSMHGDAKFTLCPILDRTLRYCRFKVLKPQMFLSPASATAEERENMLTAWRQRLAAIKNENPPTPPEICQKASRGVKNVLIVYAHHSSRSFNAAAKDRAIKTLEGQGCKVELSDLYAMKFKATTTAEDIVDCTPGEDFQYAEAAEKAWRGGKLAADISEEQRKLKEADLVILQFPMYWFSVPAILKGWMDRVLTKGFAYTDEQGFSEGLRSNTKVLLSFTTGSQESMFSAQDVNEDIEDALCPTLQATLRYCGFKVVKPHIFRSPSCATAEERSDMLTAWQERIEEELLPALLKHEPSHKASESGGSPKSKDLKRAGM